MSTPTTTPRPTVRSARVPSAGLPVARRAGGHPTSSTAPAPDDSTVTAVSEPVVTEPGVPGDTVPTSGLPGRARTAGQAAGGAARVVGLRGRLHGDDGMTTAEYAVGTVAACGFAGVLWVVIHSGAVSALLQGVVERALHLAF